MQALLDLVEQKLPDIRQHIKHAYTATPLTFRDYTGTVNGSMYGIERDYKNPYKTYISSKTKIPNFYLTGQSINNHGMLGVSVGSLITAGNVIDLVKLIENIKNA